MSKKKLKESAMNSNTGSVFSKAFTTFKMLSTIDKDINQAIREEDSAAPEDDSDDLEERKMRMRAKKYLLNADEIIKILDD
jgi:hypothetical protein